MINRGQNKRFFLLSIVLIFVWLSGCTPVTRDGPPPYNVDVTKIPDAVPKHEKLSRYGNNRSYRVFGKTYYVLSSSKNYEERGIASWYGTKFHAHHTSNGERYNMLAMTAAHKSLPLPTYVQVTNLSNGKQVIVRVNDRGPFESNRLIDLSYVAAKKLGMLGHGTAYVDIKAIDTEQFDRPIITHKWLVKNHTTTTTNHLNVYSPRATPHYSSSLYVQAGAFHNKNLAEKLRQRLLTRLSAPVTIITSSYKHVVYHVQVGPLKDNASARRIHQQLRSMGIKL